ncbi:hypothetical protein H0H93_009907 [Arthromyces matolae]|nr:hypothetical protein H0H93_009907 [Arthromyces matolae]
MPAASFNFPLDPALQSTSGGSLQQSPRTPQPSRISLTAGISDALTPQPSRISTTGAFADALTLPPLPYAFSNLHSNKGQITTSNTFNFNVPLPETPCGPAVASERLETATQQPTSRPSSPLSEPSSPSSLFSEISSPPSRTTRTTSSQGRLRPSKTNSLYGTVAGALQGQEHFEIVRPKPLPPPRKTESSSSRRFRILMPDLISRAERLSAETNCWLFVAGQNRSSASTNDFLHYQSPALLQEAYKASNAMVNTFGTAVAALITDRKEQVIDLNLRYQALSQDKEEAEKQARTAQESLAKMSDEKEILSRLLNKIKSGELSVEDIPDAIDTTAAPALPREASQ